MKRVYKVPLLISLAFLLTQSSISENQLVIRSSIKKVNFADTIITDIAAGTDHNLALDSNGNLWAWGNNNYGQLGDGTKINSYTPKQIMVGHKFKKISAGRDFSAAIDENGFLYGWGDSNNPTSTSALTPTIVSETETYSEALCSYKKCVTIKSTSSYRIPFGYGESYESHSVNNMITDINSITYNSGVKKSYTNKVIDADGNYKYHDTYSYDYIYHNFVVLDDGSVDNFFRYKGAYGYKFFDENIDLSSLENITDVSVRKVIKSTNTMFSTAYFVDKNGSIFSVGHNGLDNMLGSSSSLSMSETLTPVQVEAADYFTKVSAGENHVLALSKDGGVYSWGNNGFGQLGLGNLKSENTPKRITSFDKTKSINFTTYPGENYKDSLTQDNGNSYKVVQEPTKGTLTIDSNTGEFTYESFSNSYGNDTAILGMNYGVDYVEYQVNIFIDRKPFITNSNLSISVGYLSSYSGMIPVSDADGDVLKFAIHQYPSKGNLEIDPDTGRYTYTSKKDCAGQDEFVIRVSDKYFSVDVPVKVHIETNVTANDTTEIVLNNTNPTSYSGNMNASDLDGDKITYSIAGEPSKGSVEIDESGNYKYTPNESEYGQDTFTLLATDGKKPISLTYNVELYVAKDLGTILDHKISTGSKLFGQISVDTRNCTPFYSVKTDGSKGNVTIAEFTGEYTYTPKPNTKGADQFVINVDYGYGSFDITINVYQNTPSDTSEVVKNILTKENVNYSGNVTSTDVDGDSLRYKVVTYPRLGSIDLNELTGEYTYYPSKDTGGHDTIAIEVNDGINISTIYLKIKIESEIVVKETFNAVINQNTSLNGKVNASDKDGDQLTYKLKTSPENGSASIDSNTGEYTYVPKKDYFGTDSFVIETTDGTTPKSTKINVTINRKPITDNVEYNLIANGQSVSGSAKCNDPDGDTLTYRLELEATKGKVILDENTGNFSYIPNQDASGNDKFIVLATDGHDNVRVTINIHNETELALDEQNTNIIVNQGKSTTGKVLATDLDGDKLLYTLKVTPSKGTVNLNSYTGAWTYNSNSDATGTDSFSVEVTDGNTTKELTYSLIVNTPSEFEEGTLTTIETKQNTSYNGKVNATDLNGDAIIYSVVSQGQKGDVSIDTLTGRYVYVPKDGASGNDTFIIGASDGNFVTEIAINVHIETEIKLEEGTKTVTVNKGEVITGVTGASDEDGDTLTYKISKQGEKGSANVSQDGSWSYFANEGAGDDSFVIEISDGKNVSYLTVYVSIKSEPTFDIGNINITVGQGQKASGKALASDEDGDALEYKINAQPTNGTVNLDSKSGDFEYTAFSNNSSNTDIFTILVTDGTTTKEITVNVIINESPVISDQTLTVEQNKTATGTLSATDPENDKLTYQIGTQGAHGNVTINNETGKYIYTTTDKNYSGKDSFTILVSDGYTTKQVLVEVTIIKNKAPNVTSENISVKQNQSAEGTISGTDPENDKLTYVVNTQGKHGTVSIVKGTGKYIYVATDKTFTGKDSFIIEVSDGYSTKLVTVNVTVTPNLSPNANNGDLFVNQGGVNTGKIEASDPENDKLSYKIDVGPKHGKVTINEDTGEYTYISTNKSFNGVDSFVVAISDGYTVKKVTIDVTIIPNKAPTASNGNLTINQGEGGSGVIEATDPEKDELTYQVGAQGSHGKVTVNRQTGEYFYTPNDKNYSGTDSFVIEVTDGYTVRRVAVKVTITPNKGPVVSGDNLEVNQNGSGTGTIIATDPENDKLNYEVGTQGNHGSVSINSETGEYTYITTDKYYSGTDSFTILVSDGYTTKEVLIEVTIIKNSTPTVNAGNIVVNQGYSVTGNIIAKDPENDKLSYEVSEQGKYGNVTINKETGEYIYQVVDNKYYGKDSFKVTVSDGYTSKEVIINVQITRNESPVISGENLVVNQNGSVSGSVSATDTENDNLTFGVGSQGMHGNVIIDKETGEYTYVTTDKNYFGTDSFVVVVTDGFSIKEITINVEILANETPIINDSTTSVNQNGSVSGNIVATDPENDKLNYEVGTQGSHGKVTINHETGEYTYITTDKNFSGQDSFTIKISDGYTTKEITVFVEVVKNEAPNLNASNAQLDSGTTISSLEGKL